MKNLMNPLYPLRAAGRTGAAALILILCLIFPLSPAAAGIQTVKRPVMGGATSTPDGAAETTNTAAGIPAEAPPATSITAGIPAEAPPATSITAGTAPGPEYIDAGPLKPRVALTFDDGPHGTVTPAILDELQARGVQATFFVVGHRVLEHPDVVSRIADEGHEIGNHSWDHSRLTDLKPWQAFWQFEKTQRAVQAVTGDRPAVMRPPYGAYDETVLQVSPMPAILWSIDTRDWETRDAEMIRAAAAGARDGDIILFHDLYDSTADAIGSIIDDLTDRGFAFVTVSEMLGFGAAGDDDENAAYGAPILGGHLRGFFDPLGLRRDPGRAYPAGHVFRAGARGSDPGSSAPTADYSPDTLNLGPTLPTG